MDRRRFSHYLLWAFGFSYLCWGGLAILANLGLLSLSHPLGTLLHLLGGFGPPLAVWMICPEKRPLPAFLQALFRRGPGKKWVLPLVCLLELGAIGLSSRQLNPALPLSQVPLVFLGAVFLYGGNEELGWRGFLQPLLEERLSYPAASLLTGAIWSLWHVPLWFVAGASQQNIPFLLFAALGIVLSFILAALYRQTQCVFFCSLFHGLTNTLLSLFVVQLNWALFLGLGSMLAIAIWIWYLPREKQ